MFFRIDLFLLTLIFILQWLSLQREVLIILMSQFPLKSLQTQRLLLFISQLMTILVLIGMAILMRGYVQTWWICCYRMLWVGSGWEWCIYPTIINIRPSFFHLNGFSYLWRCHSSWKSFLFVCTNRINLLHLNWNSKRLENIGKGLFKQPNLLMLTKLFAHLNQCLLFIMVLSCCIW